MLISKLFEMVRKQLDWPTAGRKLFVKNVAGRIRAIDMPDDLSDQQLLQEVRKYADSCANRHNGRVFDRDDASIVIMPNGQSIHIWYGRTDWTGNRTPSSPKL